MTSSSDNDNEDYPIVRCPGCMLAMHMVSAEPAESNQTKLKYSCPECGTETSGLLPAADRKVGGGKNIIATLANEEYRPCTAPCK